MDERKRELRSILILLLRGKNFSKVRIMLTLAIITAYHLQETMVDWIATFYVKEDTMTTLVAKIYCSEFVNSSSFDVKA